MFCFTFVSDHNSECIMLYSVQLKNMYSYLNSSLKLSDIIRGLSYNGIATYYHYTNSSLSFLLVYFTIFTFSIHIMFSIIPSDANDPQGLMRP